MNHASVYSSIVPVLPASGQSSAAAACAVPRCTTPRSRLVITNAVSARMRLVRLGPVLLEEVAFAIGDRHHRSTAPCRTPWFGNAE